MSDINTYANEAAITGLTPINGDLVLNRDNNSLYLCTDSSASGIARWKKFTNDGEAGPWTNQYSLYFDGTNDYFDAENNATFGVNNTWTVTVWFKYTEPANTSKDVVWNLGSNPYTSLRVYSHLVQIRELSTQVNLGTLSNTEWNFAAVTFDGTYVKGFLNEEEFVVKDFGINDYSSSSFTQQPIRIGDNNYTQKFPGYIDEVAFWDSSVSETDLKSIYNDRKASNIRSFNPTSWWRMGDSDSAVVDAQPSSITDEMGVNNLTINNGAVYKEEAPSAS